jgi:hypothetical protein
MAHLLAKFRIDYTSLTMVVGITDEPQPTTTEYFNKILEGFKETDQNVDKGKKNSFDFLTRMKVLPGIEKNKLPTNRRMQ